MSTLDANQADALPTAVDEHSGQGAPSSTEWVDQDQLTRAQKALLALSGDVAHQLAEDHGVCVRPLAMRRLDLTSGRVDVVPVPCGSRWEDSCRPCADKNRRLRMSSAARASTSPKNQCRHRPSRPSGRRH
jgi:hypothetical protein